MKPYRILISESAKRTLTQLAPFPKRILRKAFKELEADPSLGEPLERELTGLHKRVIKNYRIIYKIAREKREIQVVAIGLRKTIYLDLMELLKLSEE